MTESGGFEGRDQTEPHFDQHPVDHQAIPSRSSDDIETSEPQLPGAPRLAAGGSDGPTMASIASQPAGGPLIPPLQLTSPTDFVDPQSDPVLTLPPARPMADPVATGETSDFSPLRVDPPPALVPTWWLRSALFASMLTALVLTMWVEYRGEPGDVRSSLPVFLVHLLAGVLLVLWSFFALGNAGRIVPASRYHKRSSGPLGVALWLLAAAAPIAVLTVARRLDRRFDDPDDIVAVVIMVVAVLVGFLLVWLPFRYHSRQASRVGAPHRAMLGWFYAPLLAAVGGLLMVAIGLGDLLADGGLDRSERAVQVGVAYGLPMLVFALATWRAVTVFDEVIDLRWRRWRAEWEQTLGDFVAQPAPGPEGSPSIDGLVDRSR